MDPTSIVRWPIRLGAALFVGLLACAPALAAPQQASLEDVITALGVGPQPSDYVISVDISGSMAEEGRWDTVKQSLTALSGILLPEDHVSLITFGRTATVEFDDTVGKTPQRIVDSLPPVPNGEASDIGLGISAGLDQLERKKANDVAAFVLITDGEHRADANSPYDKVGSAGWQQLRTRADQLVKQRPIAAYAVALKKGADAKLLRQVFTEVTDVPANKVTKQFGTLDADLVNVQAAEALRPDLAGDVKAEWSQPMTGLSPQGTRKLDLTLTSTLSHVPLTLSRLALDGGGVAVSGKGFPDRIDLAPGKQVSFPVEVSWSSFGSGYLQVTGLVESPWQRVITKDLKLTFQPRISSSTPISSAEPVDLGPYLRYGGLGMLAALLVFSAWFGYRISRPELVGSLSLSASGADVGETVLIGRRLSLGGKRPTSGGVTGTVRAVRRKSATGEPETGVKVSARLGKEKVRARLFDGESASLGDTTITYTAARTRMISLIES